MRLAGHVTHAAQVCSKDGNLKGALLSPDGVNSPEQWVNILTSVRPSVCLWASSWHELMVFCPLLPACGAVSQCSCPFSTTPTCPPAPPVCLAAGRPSFTMTCWPVDQSRSDDSWAFHLQLVRVQVLEHKELGGLEVWPGPQWCWRFIWY